MQKTINKNALMAMLKKVSEESINTSLVAMYGEPTLKKVPTKMGPTQKYYDAINKKWKSLLLSPGEKIHVVTEHVTCIYPYHGSDAPGQPSSEVTKQKVYRVKGGSWQLVDTIDSGKTKEDFLCEQHDTYDKYTGIRKTLKIKSK